MPGNGSHAVQLSLLEPRFFLQPQHAALQLSSCEAVQDGWQQALPAPALR